MCIDKMRWPRCYCSIRNDKRGLNAQFTSAIRLVVIVDLVPR